MALPPCHTFAQFYVTNDKRLDCTMYQRSADLFLGVPFNIASYSLLVYMIAHVTGLRPGNFNHVFGDAHIYEDHFNACKTQIERKPKPFPKLKIHREDERFTTKLSSIYLNEITKKRKVKIDKKNLDKISASIILDSYLKKNKLFYQFYHIETQF